MATDSATIRQAQQDALYKMLNLNQNIKQFDNLPSSQSNVWKVLIYDKFGQDIISPSLRLGDLRSAGITLHMYDSIRLKFNTKLTTCIGGFQGHDNRFLTLQLFTLFSLRLRISMPLRRFELLNFTFLTIPGSTGF